MRATAVKFADGTEDVLSILAIPFGGPLNGSDTDGERFTAKTDLCLDWYPDQIPLLYGHGLDDGPGVSVVGRVDRTAARKEDDGVWVQAQLDKSNAYHSKIKTLIDQQKLYASSGAMPHLVRRAKGGEIERWPWVELSLTPTPANLYAVVEPAEVVKHYKAAGIAFKGDDEPAIKATMDAAARDKLSDGDYAYIDSDGGRHLPINDAAHVRAAMSRFNQTHFESDAKKRTAAKKIIARAKKLGIDVSDDSAVASAAKSTKADDAIPADGDDGGEPEGSAEDWIDDLNGLLNRSLGGPFDSGYRYVVATFGVNGPGYCVVRCRTYGYDEDDDDTQYARVEYTMGDDGEPVLGAVTPLDRVYVPAKAADVSNLTSLALLSESAHRHADAVAQRTRDLSERRIKEGRSLSDANRQRLKALQAALSEAASGIGDLLDGSPTQAKAADGALLRILDLRTRQARLSVVE